MLKIENRRRIEFEDSRGRWGPGLTLQLAVEEASKKLSGMNLDASSKVSSNYLDIIINININNSRRLH